MDVTSWSCEVYSIHKKFKVKADCASTFVSFTQINEQIADYRKQKCQQFNVVKKMTRIEVPNQGRVLQLISCPSFNEIKY